MSTKTPQSTIASARKHFGELKKSASAPTMDDAQREKRLLELKAKVAGRTLYTIGHSTMGFSEFLALIRPETAPPAIDMVIDVRSKPFSRRAPWAKRDDLLADLPPLGVDYTWLGHLLGGLPPDAKFYGPGHKVDYPRLSRSRAYQSGLYELLKFIAWGRRAVIMCSEENPAHCHRKLLIAQSLHDLDLGLRILHIRRNHPALPHDHPTPFPFLLFHSREFAPPSPDILFLTPWNTLPSTVFGNSKAPIQKFLKRARQPSHPFQKKAKRLTPFGVSP